MLLIIKPPLLDRRFQKISVLFICALCLSLCWMGALELFSGGLPSVAQAVVNRATLTQVLDSPQVFIQDKQAKVNDSATRGQRVRTAAARAQLKFNTGAVGRLGRNSVLTVGQQCARLQQGSVLVNGATNSCAASVVAGVRGTTYVMDVLDNQAVQITVLEGQVSLQNSPDLGSTPTPSSTPQVNPAPGQPINPTALKSGDRVVVQTDGTADPIQRITREQYNSLLTGEWFEGYTTKLPGIAKIEQSYRLLYPGQPFPKIPQSERVRGLW
jgi:FecR protein